MNNTAMAIRMSNNTKYQSSLLLERPSKTAYFFKTNKYHFMMWVLRFKNSSLTS